MHADPQELKQSVLGRRTDRTTVVPPAARNAEPRAAARAAAVALVMPATLAREEASRLTQVEQLEPHAAKHDAVELMAKMMFTDVDDEAATID